MVPEILLFGGLAVVLVAIGILVFITKLYRKVEQGKALVVSTMRDVDVTFTGRVVIPIIHKAEVMDISVKTIEIHRAGAEGLICRDNIRADIKVTFFVRVNKTRDDVIKVAQSIGCARASNPDTLELLFNAKFSEALKTVGKQLDFVDLYTRRHDFRDQIIEVIGTDLNGYVLEDAAIDYLEQTPLAALDDNNILDAQGIRKITELTTLERIRTNEYQNNEKKQITKQNVEAAEAIFELERQKADAEAKQQREIRTVRAREEAEILKVQAEERLRSETARLKSDEDIAVQEENLKRQVELAQKNRERVILVENERIERERSLEVIGREREVELQRISKDKEIEGERRAIAEVIRERVKVEKTVAQEEEAIKTLRTVEEADRTRQATIITAEAEAQERLVKDIKAAEAAEVASKHKAKERLTLAEAELEAADREARGKIRLAEATRAEAAAPGLAAAEVKEKDAEATEKLGLAEARVTKEKGQAEALVAKEKGQAEALVVKDRGQSEALVIKDKGLAEGEALEAKLFGEARGLTEKAGAMKALDEASRSHEEYRLRLAAEKEIELAEITARRHVAQAQAMMVAEGLKSANIDIVGGESIFFDRLVGALSMARATDGFVNKSRVARTLGQDYLSGEESLVADLKDVLTRPALSAADLQNLTLSALLGRLLTASGEGASGGGKGAGKLRELLATVEELGLGGVKVALPEKEGAKGA